MIARILLSVLRGIPLAVVVIGGMAVVGVVSNGCIDFSNIKVPGSNGNSNSNTNQNANANSNKNSNQNANVNGSTNTNGSSNDNVNGAGNDNSTPLDNVNVNTNGGDGAGVPVNANSNSSGNQNANANSNSNANVNGSAGPPQMLDFGILAQTGDAVPDQVSGVTFTEFGPPIIDANGRVAFWALYSGVGAAGFGGLYIWENNAVRKVLDDNPASAGVVPGRTTADYFGKFQKTSSFNPLTQDLTWAGGNRLLFVSPVSGQKASRGFYRWRATDNNFARIADLEQITALYADASPGAFVPTFALPGVSDNGIGYFGVDYKYFTKPPGATLVSGQGVYSSDGSTVTVLADTSLSEATPGDVPSQGANAFFTRMATLTTLNASGDMLFESDYFDDNGSAGTGIYLARGGTLYAVIDSRPGVTWPGLATGLQYNPGSKAARFANGPLGQIVIGAPAKLNGTTYNTVLLFDFGTSLWYELTGPNGANASALLSGINDDAKLLLLSGGNPYIVGGGQRVSIADSLPPEVLGTIPTWASEGGSINNHGRAVARYTRSSNLGLVFWTGEKLLLVADPLANVPSGIASVSTITDPRRDRVGRSGLLNDSDEIVFLANLTGGGQAIYIARAR